MSGTIRHKEHLERQSQKRNQQLQQPSTVAAQSAVNSEKKKKAKHQHQAIIHTSSLISHDIDATDKQAYVKLDRDVFFASETTATAVAADEAAAAHPSFLPNLISSLLPNAATQTALSHVNLHANIVSKLAHRTVMLDNKSVMATTTTTAASATGNTNTQTQLHQSRGRPPKKAKQLAVLSSHQRKQCALLTVPKHTKYEQFLPLHELWKKYAADVLIPPVNSNNIGNSSNNNRNSNKKGNGNNKNSAATDIAADAMIIDTSASATTATAVAAPATAVVIDAQKLLTLDYHGSVLTVTRSVNPSDIGCSGICIQETQHTFKLCSQHDNSTKTIAKKHHVFAVTVIDHCYELHGNHLCYKSSERSVRKWKQRNTMEL